jgi:hypothetical protein
MDEGSNRLESAKTSRVVQPNMPGLQANSKKPLAASD